MTDRNDVELKETDVAEENEDEQPLPMNEQIRSLASRRHRRSQDALDMMSKREILPGPRDSRSAPE